MTEFLRKVCKGPCGRELSIAHSFYRSGRNRDGYMTKCKQCYCAAVYANREAKSEYYRGWQREYDKLPHRIAARSAYQKSSRGRELHNAACRRYLRWKALEKSQQRSRPEES